MTSGRYLYKIQRSGEGIDLVHYLFITLSSVKRKSNIERSNDYQSKLIKLDKNVYRAFCQELRKVHSIASLDLVSNKLEWNDQQSSIRCQRYICRNRITEQISKYNTS
uniref:AlNc14C255G9723 protein n=1 Tax=Albugo laibachii Nc14 TaxID=890382 RepID=F0WTP9_9STRA|nr:AlNc14C255G9723 [Albugo laibachii Nc14]|eukprot:CCA24741.1 AlNc14C255G9723 [Albugo laibachii Nc14]